MLVDIERDGKKYRAVVPDQADRETWQYGIPVGPPDLSELDLPVEIEVRLHNELFVRGLITLADVRRNMSSLQGALQAALRVDAQMIVQLYEEAK